MRFPVQKRTSWTPAMIERAKAWRHEGCLCSEIDDRLGIGSGSTAHKMKRVMTPEERQNVRRVVINKWKLNHPSAQRGSPLHPVVNPECVPSELFIERDARLLARQSRDLTATLCNDPPKGYSAFDLMDDSMRRKVAAAGDESL